jgi:hypothetical protein
MMYIFFVFFWGLVFMVGHFVFTDMSCYVYMTLMIYDLLNKFVHVMGSDKFNL